MVTLAPEISTSFRNQSREGLFLRPLRYCRIVLEVTPSRLAASPTDSPPLERIISRSLEIALSSQTRGVRGAEERKAGIDAEDGRGTRGPSPTGGSEDPE